MKRYRIVSILLLHLLLMIIYTGCSPGKVKLPHIGDKLSGNTIDTLEEIYIMTSSSSITKSYYFDCKQVTYILSVNDGNKVISITTYDRDFVTDEGIKIGDSLGLALANSKMGLIKERGWAFFVKLNSGWNAAFTRGEHATDTIPESNAKIEWFFKR